jgi:hypothetical protein
MNTERQQFLGLTHLPGRLNAQEAAWYLGFSPHEIPMLIGAHLLDPLGRPPEHGIKFFLRADLEPLRDDSTWMAKASDAILTYWKHQNLKRIGKRLRGKRKEIHGRSSTEKPTEKIMS